MGSERILPHCCCGEKFGGGELGVAPGVMRGGSWEGFGRRAGVGVVEEVVAPVMEEAGDSSLATRLVWSFCCNVAKSLVVVRVLIFVMVAFKLSFSTIVGSGNLVSLFAFL